MSKVVKQMELDSLEKAFGNVRDMVLLTSTKVDAGLDHTLRSALRAKKIRLQMVKNTLARKVLEKQGVKLDGAWVGTTLIAWGTESIKELSNAVDGVLDAAKKKDPKLGEKVKVKTAVADGQAVSIEQAKKMPTRLEAIGEVVGMILGPASAIAACLTGPAAQVASQVATIAEKKPEEADAPAAPPAA
jgi:large subunit ribosomal protein L10